MSFGTNPSVSPADQSGRDIFRLREKWIEAFNRHDVDGVVSLYAEDAAELPLNGTPAVNGIAAIRALVKSTFDAGFGELKIRQTQVGYTEPLAMELATYSVNSRIGNGHFRSEMGRLVATWRRSGNGEFKITISVWSKEFE
jgi:ketosteroid isomerase-like protein